MDGKTVPTATPIDASSVGAVASEQHLRLKNSIENRGGKSQTSGALINESKLVSFVSLYR